MASANNKIEIKIEKLCRTCLSKDNELNSLFDVLVGDVSLDYIVTAITGLKIRKGDGLPTTICWDCRDKAERAFDFKRKSEESHNSLKGFYKDDKDVPRFLEFEDNNEQKSLDFKTEDVVFSDRDDYSDADYCLPLKNGPSELDKIEAKVKVKHESTNKEYFECKKCCLLFETKSKYRDHQKRKCVKVEFEDQSGAHCPICGTSYDGASSLSHHMWQFHADLMGPKKRGRPKKAQTTTILSKLSENGFFIKTVQGKKHKCGFCKEQSKSKEDLSIHMLKHSDVKILCCMVCKKKYLKKRNFDVHLCIEDVKAVSKTERDPTDSTNKKLAFFTEMFLRDILDMNWDMAVNVIQVCSACSAVFLSEGDLTSHHDTEHPELSLRCNHCTKVFASVKTAARHRTMCQDIDRTHRCSTCGLKFAYEISLNKHILRYHQGQSVSVAFMRRKSKPTENQNVQYQCDTCNKMFQRKEALAKHTKLHMPNQKTYECEVCHRKFNRSDNLRTHKRIHDVNRPKPPQNNHLCLYCGRGFSNSSNLIVHMRRHTGEKPYKCDFCDKGFPRSSDLMVHRRSHTGEKPCVCRICGKAFSRSNKLSRHMRVHTGQRPYKCTYCDKAFSQSNDLTLHVRRHTGDRPYICEVCGDRFIQGTALQNHRRAHGHFSVPPPSELANQVQAITYAVTSMSHHDDSHLSNTITSI